MRGNLLGPIEEGCWRRHQGASPFWLPQFAMWCLMVHRAHHGSIHLLFLASSKTGDSGSLRKSFNKFTSLFLRSWRLSVMLTPILYMRKLTPKEEMWFASVKVTFWQVLKEHEKYHMAGTLLQFFILHVHEFPAQWPTKKLRNAFRKSVL